jgi:DNA-binding response OmpR family regulator
MEASRPKALVVDDDPALRLLIRVNLELEGFQVVEAGTLEEAETAAFATGLDVVLLDVHLGGRQTFGLLARLREAGIPVALVTGSVDVDEYRTSADAVLSKPFTPQDLIATARRLAKVRT